ncbi:hypothetical protein I550_1421 [Mycobacterium intracellulare 1956]|uniref:Uncharacterized protein n=1 Tax=Mycobacterium intracellulare 1956 TaxID=1299331 RepID=X8CR22_MYCIT|nr:hypothetical protein I550_1421 [Mycobacterium intracellulare 1956]
MNDLDIGEELEPPRQLYVVTGERGSFISGHEACRPKPAVRIDNGAVAEHAH